MLSPKSFAPILCAVALAASCSAPPTPHSSFGSKDAATQNSGNQSGDASQTTASTGASTQTASDTNTTTVDNGFPATSLPESSSLSLEGWYENLSHGYEPSASMIEIQSGEAFLFSRDKSGHAVMKFAKAQDHLSSQSWTEIGGSITGSPQSYLLDTHHVAVAVRGLGGHVYLKLFARADPTANFTTNPGNTQWLDLGLPAADVQANSAVGMGSPGDGSLALFVNGSDRNAYKITLSSDLQKADWKKINGPYVGSPLVLSDSKDHLDLIERSEDGTLKFARLASGGDDVKWESLDAPSATVHVAAQPSATSWAENRIDMVVTGTDGNLYHKAMENGVWQKAFAPLGGPVLGHPTIASKGVGQLDILVRSGDGMNNAKDSKPSGKLLVKSFAANAWIPSQTTWNIIDRPAADVAIADNVALSSSASKNSYAVVLGSDSKIYGNRLGDAKWDLFDSDETGRLALLNPPELGTGTVVFDESIQLMPRTAGGPAYADLFFVPDEILSIRDSYLGLEYAKDIDWKWTAGSNRIELVDGSNARSLPVEFSSAPPFMGEDNWYHKRQLMVSYRRAKGASWPVAQPKVTADLPKTMALLKAGSPLSVVAFGDSITEGFNSSALEVHSDVNVFAIPPYQASWSKQFALNLGKAYKSPITYANEALHGQTTVWGVANVNARVCKHKPDLMILAFGMNDKGVLSVDQYLANTKAIMATVKACSPNVEFVVVASMLQNPALGGDDVLVSYLAQLKTLEAPGVAIMDMTTTHGALLTKKAYLDMTGNSINHPGDFLGRWYNYMISSMLGAVTK